MKFIYAGLLSVVIFFIPISLFSQVNLQTGAAIFDIPIFQYQDNRSNLSLPISLNYNGGMGLKVDEVASDIGQGWGLMAGGKITRLQVGEPDDQVAYGGEGAGSANNSAESATNLYKYPNGFLFTDQNASLGAPAEYPLYPVFPEKNKLYRQHNIINADRELDYFLLNVNGITATFVVKKGTNEGVFLGSTLMKVKFVVESGSTQVVPAVVGTTFTGSTTRTVIKKFIVTDGNGIEYVFEKKAYTKLQRLSSCDRRYLTKFDAPKKYSKGHIYYETYFDETTILNPYIVNEWHLTEIHDKTLNNPEWKISFNYDYRYLENVSTGFDYNVIKSEKNGLFPHTRTYSKAIAKRSTIVVPILTSISCPNGYSITFSYIKDRLDLLGCKMLSAISVIYNGRVVQKHILNQSYVIYTRYGTPVTNEEKLAARLYLLGLTKQTYDLSDEEKPYVFDYYLGSNNNADFVPPPFFASKDIGGYFDGYLSLLGSGQPTAGLKSFCVEGTRGRTDNEFPSFDQIKRLAFMENSDIHAVKDGAAKNGLLKTIKYPTGALLEYNYEQNKGKYYGVSMADQNLPGVHVAKTTTYDAGYSNGCNGSKGIEVNYLYVDEGSTTSSLRGVENPINQFISKSSYKPYDVKYKFKPWKLTPIQCDYEYKYPGICYADQIVELQGLSKIISSSGYAAVSAAMSIYSTVSNIVTLVSAGFKGTGVLAFVGLVIDAIMSIYETVQTCFIQDDVRTTTLTTWFNKDLNAANPLPILYKRVESIEHAGENGKTVNEFTSLDEYLPWVSQNSLFNMQQRYGSWYYGQPRRTVVYRSDGQKLKEVINTYRDNCTQNFASAHEPSVGDMASRNRYFALDEICNFGRINLNLISCNILTLEMQATKSSDWQANAQNPTYPAPSNGWLRVEEYDLYSGKLQLLKTEQKEYEQNDPSKYVSNVTGYGYYAVTPNVPDLLLPNYIYEVPSSGPISVKRIYYSYWDNNGNTDEQNAVLRLKSSNIYTVPVQTDISIRNTLSSSDIYLSSERTGFTIINGWGSVKPKTKYIKRTNQPNYFLDEKVISENFYDNEGILIGMIDEGGRSIRYLNDYDKQLNVATVINAASTETVAYSSFETSANNGVSYSGNITSGISITGSKYANIVPSTPIAITMANIGKPYTVSFWSTSPLAVTNASLINSGPLRKGYTWYEYKINPGITSTSITGTAHVDELRLYPSAARMTTVTYDPLIGKTSECDATNRFTSYEYDGRGRLRMVKDDNDDIVKLYEYNQQQEPERCPVTYGNHFAVRLTKRNNCNSGFVGGYYESTVAANTYTSTISQEHADLLAQLDLDTKAQNEANSSGTCIQLFKNSLKTGIFYSDNCSNTQAPVAYTYTVPADKYTSTLSQQDADDQAQDELDDMGQDMADLHGTCSATTDPVWQGDANSQKRCQTVNGYTTGVTEVQLKNVNPNSGASYNTYQWFAMEENVLGCAQQTSGSGTATVAGNNPFNENFTITLQLAGSSNPLPDFMLYGQTGGTYLLGWVPAGTYTLTIAVDNANATSFAASVSTSSSSFAGTLSGDGSTTAVVYNIVLNNSDQLFINISCYNASGQNQCL